jgi:phosphoribosylformylglycinamidine cyclo-ligase
MTRKDAKAVTYKDAGVDIDAGEAMVDRIRPHVERTRTQRVMGSVGGFAGLFRLDYNEKLFQKNYAEPVLVACADGVGSKLKLAFATGILDTVGIDLVAMNVNDMICCGAEPLFFVDYAGVSKLDPDQMALIVKGISDGCVQSGCALLGGETAELPDMYAAGEFDLAGFAVGVVERKRIIDGTRVRVGDAVIALASDGLHSNGYGLARRVLLGRRRFRLDDKPAELQGVTIGEEMLRPTRIYVPAVTSLLARYRVKRPIKAMANITGGGLPGNLPRVLPDGFSVRIKRNSWPVPPIFELIAETGPVDPIEMARVFNMGVGFVMVVAPGFAGPVMNHLRRAGERCWILGKVREGRPALQWA